MSYTNLLNNINDKTTNQNINNDNNPQTQDLQIQNNPAPKLFHVQDFIDDLNDKSHNKNKEYRNNAQLINSYDIAHNCIRDVVFKLLHYPIADYHDVWLPISLRANIGNAIHDFIQSTYTGFTEQEVSMKVPSIKCSTRIDCLINNNVLVEIKSCTYTDYYKIIKSKRPRDEDFYQTLLYKYLLENHLQEIQSQQNTRTPPPKLDHYNIELIQLIYVAHDIMSSDVKSFSEAQNNAKQVKQLLQSRQNQFHFITSIDLNLTKLDITEHMNWLLNKIKRINYYIDNQIIPPMNDEYILTKGCFFCLYKQLCGQYGGNNVQTK